MSPQKLGGQIEKVPCPVGPRQGTKRTETKVAERMI